MGNEQGGLLIFFKMAGVCLCECLFNKLLCFSIHYSVVVTLYKAIALYKLVEFECFPFILHSQNG